LGVAALITVLSVMNGLASELRDRLLSLSAHASLSEGGAAIPDWRQSIQQLSGIARALGRGAVSGYRRHAEPPAGHERRHRARHRPHHGAQVSGPLPTAMREGKLSDLEPGANRIILGRMLAYQLRWGWATP
jgi:lipoprotein-releasing system permease protein